MDDIWSLQCHNSAKDTLDAVMVSVASILRAEYFRDYSDPWEALSKITRSAHLQILNNNPLRCCHASVKTSYFFNRSCLAFTGEL
jgi:hypothetical protein